MTDTTPEAPLPLMRFTLAEGRHTVAIEDTSVQEAAKVLSRQLNRHITPEALIRAGYVHPDGKAYGCKRPPDGYRLIEGLAYRLWLAVPKDAVIGTIALRRLSDGGKRGWATDLVSALTMDEIETMYIWERETPDVSSSYSWRSMLEVICDWESQRIR